MTADTQATFLQYVLPSLIAATAGIITLLLNWLRQRKMDKIQERKETAAIEEKDIRNQRELGEAWGDFATRMETKYTELESKYNDLVAQHATTQSKVSMLEAENANLRTQRLEDQKKLDTVSCQLTAEITARKNLERELILWKAWAAGLSKQLHEAEIVPIPFPS